MNEETHHNRRGTPHRAGGFSCKDNDKWHVWMDFEKRILNEELIEQIDEGNGKFYTL